MLISCVQNISNWRQILISCVHLQNHLYTTLIQGYLVNSLQARRVGIIEEWLQKREITLSYDIRAAAQAVLA